ncbi:MAG: hypothetical protein RR328_05845, partial [Bacteroidales bacterium]
MYNFNHKIISLLPKRKARLLSVSLFLLLLLPGPLTAQFYTGSELSFGRKRVQYETFFWSYYRFSGFDVYFNKQGKNLALYTSNYVQNHLKEMQKRVGFQSQDAIRFIIFNRLSDYRQSNIGYVDENNYNTGGVTKFLGNKIFLYFNGDYVDFERQIREGIAAILIDQSLKGTSTAAQYKSSYLVHLPIWFTGGLAAYYANPWDLSLDERMQIAIQQKKFKYITALTGEEAIFAGHSFWYFVAHTYGEDAVARCIRVLASERSMEKAVAYALNIKFKTLLGHWRDFYLHTDSAHPREEVPLGTVLKRTNRLDRIYQQLVLSPDGKHIAYVANQLGRSVVYLYTFHTGRRQKIYKTGASIDDKPDYTYPILAWHPQSDILGIATEEKGHTTLHLHSLKKGKKGRVSYTMDFFEKILDFDFSDPGRALVLSAVQQGQSDIFQFFLGAGTTKQITFDIYDDLHPRYLPGSTQIVFSSNRPNDSLLKNEKFEKAPSLPIDHRLYLYNLEDQSTQLLNLTPEKNIHYQSPENYAPNFLAFLNNENGITNLSLGQFGKEILSIDTSIHYRQTFDFRTISNYHAGLKSIQINPTLGKNAEILSLAGKNVLQTVDLQNPQFLFEAPKLNNPPTIYQQYLQILEDKKTKKIQYEDSIYKADSLAKINAMLLDTNHRIDSLEKGPTKKIRRRTFMSLRQSRTGDIAKEMLQDGFGSGGYLLPLDSSSNSNNNSNSNNPNNSKDNNDTLSKKNKRNRRDPTPSLDYLSADPPQSNDSTSKKSKSNFPQNEYQRMMQQIHRSMGLQNINLALA